MKSAGNDIVALASINKQRTNEFRFYSKILSISEQALYHEPQFIVLPFEHYVWLLWSVKESAYKYLKRINPELIFSPTKIIIQYLNLPSLSPAITGDIEWHCPANESLFTGGVVCGDDVLFFLSKIDRECITSVVNDIENFAGICWGADKIDDTTYHHQSKAAKGLLIKQLNTYFPGDLRIEKSPVGFPVILNNKTTINIPASLAHDGYFVSYSFHIASN